MKGSKFNIRKIAFLSVFLALALILSYFESLIPVFLPIPGAKIGLPNLVSLLLLELYSFPWAFLVLIGRIILSAFLFGSFSSMLYALSGGVLSLCVMALLRKSFSKASLIFVSIFGAVCHNLGQLVIAGLVIKNWSLLRYYFPYLILLAIPLGLLIGLITYSVLPYIKRFMNKDNHHFEQSRE